ncbi:MAG: DUF1343 domain-containing protein [Acholeplasmataceae bacterium]|nr:DUF1343 domain-containing protein [Acholeplasmataceae bacterium]
MYKAGIERLDEYLDLFKNKRVGLITNPTGVDENFETTIDILFKKTNLVALFSPEHGVRGDLQAGVHLDTYLDEKTGCTVFSLYGETRKPTKEMMDQIDILCFDIQDVGARYYTFIYTMSHAMMACKEYGKEFVVFDRPNPVGGIEVEGTILDLEYRSFVGYYPLTQRYGLTPGELSLLYNKEFEIDCKLHVVKMDGWKRSYHFSDLNRQWVLPSPNIPTIDTLYAYLTTCYFEGTNVSEGRGTAKPFSIFGAPWMDADKLISELNKKDLKGVVFRKTYFTPMFSKHKDTLCQGVELYVTNKDIYKPVSTGYTIIYLIRELFPDFKILDPYRPGGKQMIDLLSGDDNLKTQRLSLEEILKKIEEDSKVFKAKKERYHLYEV